LFLSDNKIKDLTPIYKLGLHVDLLGGIIINISPEGVPAIDGGYSCECDRSSCVCDRLQPTTPTQPIPELKKNTY
jgi:internalin A